MRIIKDALWAMFRPVGERITEGFNLVEFEDTSDDWAEEDLAYDEYDFHREAEMLDWDRHADIMERQDPGLLD